MKDWLLRVRVEQPGWLVLVMIPAYALAWIGLIVAVGWIFGTLGNF